MSFQPLFLRFHEAIKLNNFDENATLREKRDIILEKLRAASQYSFTTFNQGSYAMNTGVQPLDKDYDLDVGVVFRAEPETIDAHVVKGIVYNALATHTQRVEWREPCISVYYQKSGEAIYHVDLPVYAEDRFGRLHLARGKQHASSELRRWEQQGTRDFIALIKGHLAGEDALQFRRVIRYLKRWKDVHFSSQGNAAPVGIGITLAAHRSFSPVRSWGSTGASAYNDLDATLGVARWMHVSFNYRGRLELKMPVTPRDDVMRKMTDQQMTEFRTRLEKLIGWLEEAKRTGTSTALVRAFGSEFPIS